LGITIVQGHLRSSKLILIKSSYAIFIARQHTDARYWYSKSVRLSVCQSVCPLCSGIR